LKLLTAGAAAHINFDTWLKSAKVSGMSDRLGNLEQNQKFYKESVEQPLITAIRSGHTDIAIKLLENGADPNSLNTETQRLMVNEYQRSYTKGRSVLDLVRSSLKRLRGYTGKKKELAAPMETPGLDEFLSKFTAGTYSHWIVSTEVDDLKKQFAHKQTIYEKQIGPHTEPKGLSEKLDAIRELLTGFEAVEEALTSRGGKSFNELHPDIKTGERSNNTSYHSSDKDEKAPKPFDFHFSFNNDRDMTEKRRDAYIEL
jgi:hypothetical protein